MFFLGRYDQAFNKKVASVFQDTWYGRKFLRSCTITYYYTACTWVINTSWMSDWKMLRVWSQPPVKGTFFSLSLINMNIWPYLRPCVCIKKKNYQTQTNTVGIHQCISYVSVCYESHLSIMVSCTSRIRSSVRKSTPFSKKHLSSGS